MKLNSKSINYNVQTVDELVSLDGLEGDTVVVTDENRGGVFVYREDNVGTNNGGTIFNGWNRQYDGAVNVKWFGAVGDGITDNTLSVQNAFNVSNLIYFSKDGLSNYVINGTINKTKSTIIIDPEVTISGTSSFLYSETNGGQKTANAYFLSNTNDVGGSSFGGGIATVQIDMIQPSNLTVPAQHVGLYAGAKSASTRTDSNIWTTNFLLEASSGANGTFYGIELDLDLKSTSANMVGLLIAGTGQGNGANDINKVRKGVELVRSDGSQFEQGIAVSNARKAIQINPTLESVAELDVVGMQIGSVSLNSLNTGIAIRQIGTVGNCIRMQRWSNSDTSGYALEYIDESGTTTVAGIKHTGEFFSKNGVVLEGGIFTLGAIQSNSTLIGSSLNIGGNAGASGTFTTTDGKTVTVIGGMISSIV